jgi:hypothetical protein
MAYGTWDEASVCPRCGLTGERDPRPKRVKARGADGKRIIGVTEGAMIHTLYCRNSRCRWFNTPWEVQVNPDGTIPDPNARRRKQFDRPDPAIAELMRNRAQSIQEATLRPGGEVRR